MTRTPLSVRVAVPPVAAFLLLAAYVAAEATGFRALARPEAETVAEAAALGHAARTLSLIAQGQDVNARMRVRAGLIDRTEHDLTPLEAAIAGRHAELVRLLLRSGATTGDTDRVRALCLARMRLPEILTDIGGSGEADADGSADVETALKTCVQDVALWQRR